MLLEPAQKARLLDFCRRLCVLETDEEGNPIHVSGYCCLYLGKTWRDAYRTHRRRESKIPWSSEHDPQELADHLESRIMAHAEGKGKAWVDAHISSEPNPHRTCPQIRYDVRDEDEDDSADLGAGSSLDKMAGALARALIHTQRQNTVLIGMSMDAARERMQDAHEIGYRLAVDEHGSDSEVQRALVEQIPQAVDLGKAFLGFAAAGGFDRKKKRKKKKKSSDGAPDHTSTEDTGSLDVDEILDDLEAVGMRLGAVAMINPESMTPAHAQRMGAMLQQAAALLGLQVIDPGAP